MLHMDRLRFSAQRTS